MMMSGDVGEKIVTMNGKVYTVRFEEDFVRVASVVEQEVDLLNELDVSKLYHCDGLLLCVGKDKKDEEPKLVLWNPYLSQTRLIEPREEFNVKDRYAIGYDDSRNHKILRFVDVYTRNVPERKHEVRCEVYEIRSNSWRVLDVVTNPEWRIELEQRGVSVKGNTYFYANHITQNHGRYGASKEDIFLLRFDFTKERFGPRLPLPFNDAFDGFSGDIVTLSSFFHDDDEQLAVLFGGYESGFFEIWVTLSVDEPNRASSWTRFLRVEAGFGFKLSSSVSGGSFFVDEENKVAVLFELDGRTNSVHTAFVYGQEGGFKSFLYLGEALLLERRSPMTNRLSKAARSPLVCSSSYRPSLVQVHVSTTSPKETHVSTCSEIQS